jgi:hypothetical protein
VLVAADQGKPWPLDRRPTSPAVGTCIVTRSYVSGRGLQTR